MNDLGLVTPAYGLGERVLVTVADTTDRGLNPGFQQPFRLLDGDILDAPAATAGRNGIGRCLGRWIDPVMVDQFLVHRVMGLLTAQNGRIGSRRRPWISAPTMGAGRAMAPCGSPIQASCLVPKMAVTRRVGTVLAI